MFAFGFTNLWMLGWLAAAAVPLVIHLWNRRQHRDEPWAAMQFLLAALHKNSRRLRVENWILLAIRTAIVVLIVIALAGPYLEQSGAVFTPGQRAHKIFVIDASYSMGYRQEDKTRFEAARQLATQMVERSQQGDGFTLVLMGEPARVIVSTPTYDADSFVKELRSLELPHAGADLAGALSHVERLIAEAAEQHPRLARHEVYFFSDLGARTWSPKARAGEPARQQIMRLADSASMYLVDVGQDDTENLAVTDLSIKEAFVTTSESFRVDAALRNFGRKPQKARLQLLADGLRVQEEQLELGAGEEASVTFVHRFSSPGPHHLEAKLLDDRVAIDNSRYLALEVKPYIRALCVSGNGLIGGYRGEADYLAVALNPELNSSSGPVRVDVVTEGRLSELNLADYDCVFLCNVSQFTSNEAGILQSYVQNGGGLVYFLGDRVLPQRYNLALGPGGANILPALPLSAREDSVYRFDALQYEHPLMKPFAGNERSGLLIPQVYRYWRLEPMEDLTPRTAMGFESTADPAIVEANVGRGRATVIAFPASMATSSGEPWTVMPKLPAFVPLAQQLLARAVSRRLEERTVQVGRPLEGLLGSPVDAAAVEMKTPSGGRQQPRIHRLANGSTGWSLADTWQSGIYRLEGKHGADVTKYLAVNVGTAESDLTRVAAADLPSQIATLNHEHDQVTLAPASSGSEASLQLWFLYAVLGLLFVETLVAWLFGYLAS